MDGAVTAPSGRSDGEAGVDLAVDLGHGVTLANPITTASGCFASGAEIDRFFDIAELGAVVVKSVTPRPRAGLPTPRMAETPSGMLNAIGLQNPGIDAWLAHDYPYLHQRGVPTIVSIAAETAAEFAQVAAKLVGLDAIRAVEINLSCPNVEHRGLVFACAADPAAQVVAGVRTALPDLPLFAKLTPDVTDITAIGRAVVDAGATGVSAINTTLGMAIDAESGRPRLYNTYGGLSGPAIRPIAIRAVHQLHTALGPAVPIIGMGGIRTVTDVVEMVRAGASMVAIGTATFTDPFVSQRLVGELRTWMAARGHRRLSDLRGRVHPWSSTTRSPP
jgi:dihydroorotate dehydrogenase (NAD+) catalytic subunit